MGIELGRAPLLHQGRYRVPLCSGRGIGLLPIDEQVSRPIRVLRVSIQEIRTSTLLNLEEQRPGRSNRVIIVQVTHAPPGQRPGINLQE